MKKKSSISLRNIFKGFNKKKRRNNNTQEQSNPAPHERHGTTSDKISVAVNSILAVFTLAAIYFAYQANQTSIDSLKYVKHKDSIDNIEQVKKDVIAENERLFNRQYVDSTLYISQQGVKASNRSSQISEQALIETRRGYDFSRESAIKEIRAYVSCEGFVINNLLPDSAYSIDVDIINLGKTPAYNLQTIVGQVLATSENNKKSFDLTNGLSRISDYSTVTVLGANQITKGQNLLGGPIPKNEFHLIKEGAFHVFVGVNIIYYDIFNNKHFTHVLCRYDFKIGKFILCHRYNESN